MIGLFAFAKRGPGIQFVITKIKQKQINNNWSKKKTQTSFKLMNV